MRRTILGCLAVAAVAAAVVTLAGNLEPPGPPAPTMKTLQEVEPRVPIHAAEIPLTIASSGAYYLVEDATGVGGSNGITIAAPDVTLDLNGFALIGVPGSGSGIHVNAGADRARISNGTVRNWGNRGVGADLASATWVDGVAAISNGSHGIHVRDGATVRDCTARDNGFSTTSDGIAAEDQCFVTGCLSQNNARFGFNVTNESYVVLSNATGNPSGNYLFQTGSSGSANR